jgi:hypothetical protein
LLGWQTRSRPTIISGQVIDWGTGKPAAYTDVMSEYSGKAARTDGQGRFTFVAPHGPDYHFLFAGSPRYGRLLQTFFGQTVVAYRGGEEIRNVVIPAIPATSLTGHVYDSDGRPIAGCDVAAITRDNQDSDRSVDLRHYGYREEALQADDPNKFIEAEIEQTNSHGEYRLTYLGADRYFIVARCRETGSGGGTGPHLAWEPVVYPHASSIDQGQEIVLWPGDKRAGIDLHVRRKPSYQLIVDVIFDDHSVAKPYRRYELGFNMLRADRALTSTSLGQESYDWVGNATVKCGWLFPGTYSVYIALSGGPFPKDEQTQFAKTRYTMKHTASTEHLTVQLHKVPAPMPVVIPKGPSGFLDTGKPCETAVDGTSAIFALAWGHGHAGGKCYLLRFWGDTRLPVPVNDYKFIAFEEGFAVRNTRLGGHSKVEALISQEGVAVDVREGQTIRPATRVMKTSEIISLALDSLRAGRR